MTTQPDPDLRTTLHVLADSTTPLPVDDGLWQRGQAARRRAQAFAVAAVLAVLVSVAGVATLVTTTDREARTASGEVPEGAIPSTIVDTTNVPFETELPIGRASVAFALNGGFTLIGAEDGRYHPFAIDDPALASARKSVIALSPDGMRVAWATTDRIAIGDLETGDVTTFVHNGGRGAEVSALTWRPDSTLLLWNGRADGESVGGIIDVTGPSESPFTIGPFGSRGVLSPSTASVALPSRGEVAGAPFLLVPEYGGDPGEQAVRPLPTDLYPAGALVRPLGWATDDLVVALVDPPQSDVVERPRLAVFTSPDRPESEWVWREFLFRLPPVESLSIAVDLIPDLTGDPAQELTHDFDAAAASSDDPLALTPVEIVLLLIGVALAVAVLLALRWLWRRRP